LRVSLTSFMTSPDFCKVPDTRSIAAHQHQHRNPHRTHRQQQQQNPTPDSTSQCNLIINLIIISKTGAASQKPVRTWTHHCTSPVMAEECPTMQVVQVVSQCCDGRCTGPGVMTIPHSTQPRVGGAVSPRGAGVWYCCLLLRMRLEGDDKHDMKEVSHR
jgi:hypothetical protein